MRPSFKGSRIVTDIGLEDIFPLIDTRSLFTGRWQFKRTKGSEEAYQDILKQKAWPAFEEWKKRSADEHILRPKVVYGYFDISQVPNSGSQSYDFAPLQVVTVGAEVVKKCQWLFAAHKYTDYLYLHGLAVETTEALAEFWHRKILSELEIPFDAARPLPTFSRISPGYKAWPEIEDQRKIFELLKPERIGVTLTETLQMVPEYSISAMIVV